MRAWLALLAACSSPERPAPTDKLGSDDVAEAERPRTPNPEEVGSVWRALFVEGATWQVDTVACKAWGVEPIFGGWRASILCDEGEHSMFSATFVADYDRILLVDADVTDIRRGRPVEVRAFESDLHCLHADDDQTLCVRPFTGIVGGANHRASWGTLPRSW